MSETALIRYDAMVYAIAECHRVDEVKDIRDKAMALEAYARQAKNTEAERKAADVRLRGERRSGELLAELARGEAGRPKKNSVQAESNFQQAKRSAGISDTQATRWQQLANVPKAQFEAALRDPDRKPSTIRIINEARDPQPKLPDDSLWIWGRARDFERDNFAQKDPEELLAAMTETMRADMERIIPTMAAFFERFMETLNEHA
jgi:hypothetical protein